MQTGRAWMQIHALFFYRNNHSHIRWNVRTSAVRAAAILSCRLSEQIHQPYPSAGVFPHLVRKFTPPLSQNAVYILPKVQALKISAKTERDSHSVFPFSCIRKFCIFSLLGSCSSYRATKSCGSVNGARYSTISCPYSVQSNRPTGGLSSGCI